MPELPSGTVTFLFTDVEGSTRLLQEHADAYAELLAEHRRVLRAAFARHGGVEVDTQGDAFFVAFSRATEAVAAACEGQAALAGGRIRVRMGLHTGEPLVSDDGYVGLDVHKGARIAAAGHGGQVLLSQATRDLLDDALPLRDLGEHRLKDLTRASRIFQVGAVEFPPLKTLNATNLPVAANPLVGRVAELAELRELLASERLVTLTGPGGTGKTRLALQVGAELVDEHPGGVFFVPLAGLAQPELVAPAIAQAVGARDLAEIGAREALLIVDNFEHLLEAAPAISGMLESADGARVLATSRAPLRIAGEREYPLEPLSETDAAELLIERARAVRPDFEPDEAVRELCRRLDGLPLALELAAPRLRSIGPRALLQRLDRRLPLLTGGRRDAPRRQRTLRATIEWSYDLLDDTLQKVFRRLGVFAGPFSLTAAARIAGAEYPEVDALVEASLLKAFPDDRILMLETIRELASEQLEASGEADSLSRLHAAYYLELAESANLSVEALGRGPQRHDLVLREQDNLRAALDWAVDADVELGLRLAVALENFWATQDPAESRRRFELLLGRAEGVDVGLRAKALRDYAGCTELAGDYDRAEPLYVESGDLFRQVGDESGVATATFRVGVVASRRGDLDRARRLWEESYEAWRRLGDVVGELQAVGNLGWLELEHGDRGRGRQLVAQGLEMARRIGWVWWEVNALIQLADDALQGGRTDEGVRRAKESLTRAREIEDRQGTVYGLALLAWGAALRGDGARSRRLWAAIEAEEAKGGLAWWRTERDAYAARIPEGPPPDATPSLKKAVEEALSLD